MNIDLYKFRHYAPDATQEAAAPAGETEGDDIAAMAYAEMDGRELPKKKEPPVEGAEPVEEQPATEEAGEPQVKEGEEAEPSKKEEGTASEGQEGAEAKTGSEVAPEPIAEERIQAFAEKQGVTYLQAKEELEESQRLLAKYGNDPLELARAARNTQREYDRLKGEAKKPEAETATELLSDDELKSEVKAYADANTKQIVEKYRKDYPKRTELMDDESILEWAQDDAIRNYKTGAVAIVEKHRKAATDRRSALLETIPKEDVKFLHDVKLVLDATPDRVVLNPKYDVKGLVWHAKGQRYDADMKASYDRGLKAGKEQPTILGTTVAGGGGNTPKKPVSAGRVSLNANQKQQALDQFPDSVPAKAEEMWMDLYKEDLKKNPNFLPV